MVYLVKSEKGGESEVLISNNGLMYALKHS